MDSSKGSWWQEAQRRENAPVAYPDPSEPIQTTGFGKLKHFGVLSDLDNNPPAKRSAIRQLSETERLSYNLPEN
jgi:hypothetical protein